MIVNIFYANQYKMSKKNPGRPKKYDKATALNDAMGVFWVEGYTKTSVDQISLATKMKRPSLYSAFGNKKSIYRKASAAFSDSFLKELENRLNGGPNLKVELQNFYFHALTVFNPHPSQSLGCPVLSTAIVAAATDEDIRKDLAKALNRIDAIFELRFELALENQELPLSIDPRKLSKLAGALFHSLSLRVRAQQPNINWKEFINNSVETLLP